MSRKQAIDQKCKDCNYDPLDRGTWRQQIERCTATDCPLWEYRPKSRAKSDSVAKTDTQLTESLPDEYWHSMNKD